MSDNDSESRSMDIILAQQLEDGLTQQVDYPEAKKEHHKRQFEDWLFKKYSKTQGENESESKKITSYVMKKAEYDAIRDVLMGVKKIDKPCDRFQFRKKNFSLIDGKVARTIFFPKTMKRQQERTETKKLIYLEEFFEILYDAHCIKRMHAGILIFKYK